MNKLTQKLLLICERIVLPWLHIKYQRGSVYLLFYQGG